MFCCLNQEFNWKRPDSNACGTDIFGTFMKEDIFVMLHFHVIIDSTETEFMQFTELVNLNNKMSD